MKIPLLALTVVFGFAVCAGAQSKDDDPQDPAKKKKKDDACLVMAARIP